MDSFFAVMIHRDGWVVWWLLRGGLLLVTTHPHDPFRPVSLREIERGVYAHGDGTEVSACRLLVALSQTSAVVAGSGVLGRTEGDVKKQRTLAHGVLFFPFPLI